MRLVVGRRRSAVLALLALGTWIAGCRGGPSDPGGESPPIVPRPLEARDAEIPDAVRSLLREGRGPQAIDRLQAALRARPPDASGTNVLMRLYRAVGDDAAVVALARRVLDDDPRDPAAAAFAAGRNPFVERPASEDEGVDRGMELFGEQRWLEAAEVFSAVLEDELHSAYAWNNLGWARAKLGFFDPAVPCFRRAFDLDPEMITASGNLKWAKERSKETTRRPPDPTRLR